MNVLIPAFIGCIIGICLYAITLNFLKSIPEAVSSDDGFWYTLTFIDPELGFKNIIAMFATRYINVLNIATARDKSGATKDAILVSMTYLGKDTIENFTANLEEKKNEQNNNN